MVIKRIVLAISLSLLCVQVQAQKRSAEGRSEQGKRSRVAPSEGGNGGGGGSHVQQETLKCSICLDQITQAEQAPEQSKCLGATGGITKHPMHKQCLNSWLVKPESGGKCPVCKKKLRAAVQSQVHVGAGGGVILDPGSVHLSGFVNVIDILGSFFWY